MFNFSRDNLTTINDNAGLSSVPGNLSNVVNQLPKYLFSLAGIILILNIISAGFKMMTSAGEPKALQMAQSKLTTSLIGILILFTSYWIVKLILQFFGINVSFIDIIV